MSARGMSRWMGATAAVGVVAAMGGAAPGAGWVDLFNGHNLTGWVASGSAVAWGVENGEIVVKHPGEGGWLHTTKMYRDFELELEFLVPQDGNSGVGLRGSSNGDPAFTGFEVQILDSAGREPDLRNCGAVYEAIAPDQMAVKPPGEWNKYEIKLVGDRLSVRLNGVTIHDNEKLDDRGFFRNPENPMPLNARATTGYIALQDHGDAVRFRNIRLRDLSPDPEPDGMRSLIDDRLTEWTPLDAGSWTVEDGALVGRDGPGHLFTSKVVYNFELRALVKVNDNGASGIYFRARPNRQEDVAWPVGYEAQIDNHDPKSFTGCIYHQACPDRDGPITHDDAWFDYRIRAVGSHIQTWINGVPMVDATLDEYDLGHLALQTHHKGNVVEYRDVRVVNLPRGQ